MSSSRVWLFRGLVIIAAGLMLLSWFRPWWICTVDAIYMLNQGLIKIRPWGLEHNLGSFAGHIAGSDMPVWFTPLAWAYLGICIAALLFAAWIKEKVIRLIGRNFNLSRLIIGAVGISYIMVAVIAFVYAKIRTAEFGVNFLGYTYFQVDPHAGGYGDLNANLCWGYWLAYVVGLILIALALLRNKILGKSE
jgi:hypothetical protein